MKKDYKSGFVTWQRNNLATVIRNSGIWNKSRVEGR